MSRNTQRIATALQCARFSPSKGLFKIKTKANKIQYKNNTILLRYLSKKIEIYKTL